MFRRQPFLALICLLALARLFGFQQLPNHLADPFLTGWFVTDTNGDGIADFLAGKIVVPRDPTADENAAAANIAARAGYATTGLTPPTVISQPGFAGPKIFIGRATPAGIAVNLDAGEGGVFTSEGNVSIVGHDAAGLTAAANAYAARAPYVWKVPGEKLETIAASVPGAELYGVTYLHGKAGIHRAFLRGSGISAEALQSALAKLTNVHELVVTGGVSAVSDRPEADAPPEAAPASPAAAGGGEGPANAAPTRLDLATLFTSRGLFGGAGRIPLPASSNAHLYVPAGEAGIAMANLAARIGLETTGLTLPIASAVEGATAREVRTQAVVPADSVLGQAAVNKLKGQDTAFKDSETPLAAGEGELRIVDNAFGRRAAVVASGDPSAVALLSDRFPNVWEQGKQYASLEEVRYDLHRFFSLRSPGAQAAAALYHLSRWAKELEGARDVQAEIYTDIADAHLASFAAQQLPAGAQVKTGSLHAGTQCCAKNPDLHYHGPNFTFQQPPATFTEDIEVPWEGRRLIEAVRRGAAKIGAGQAVTVRARVSEGPEQRHKLETQIREILAKAGASKEHSDVKVLCAFKQGYSWLMDEVAPALAGKPVASLKIEFAKNVDASGIRSMHSEARWVQELYPVDEMLARKLNVPLSAIALEEFEPAPKSPTYRVHAMDAAGREILSREFTVSTHMQPYNGVIPRYEQVEVETGWVRMEAAGKPLLDQRIPTDLEQFWDHYQNQTLPKVYRFILAQAHGELRQEFMPPFDTLTLDFHMSEPDFSLDLDKERISTLEAVQEDTFYSTETFFNIMGDLETGRPVTYTGRIIPIVHAPEDGKDGHVHIEFYGKPAANPLVRLAWTDAQGRRHKEERNLPALSGEMQPRLIQARVKAGEAAIERLVWSLPADFAEDKYDDWLKLEGQDQVDRSIFSVEQARGELEWMQRMHAAGLYRDELAWPHIRRMGIEFDLPIEPGEKPETPPRRMFAEWQVPEPATPRPLISDVKKVQTTPMVQWDEPISPAESASILARMAEFPGVRVYWMGRSYLGENIWAADVMLPSPALLRSPAKEETLKPAIVYSGRQHANEVSSTSHILKLAEELLTQPDKRELLKKVNVVLHPITNPDGAQLSVDLAKITPDNLLHPGYHGSLAADVSTGQTETDPVYPESRTRKQLIDAWLPDAFLNPHGYPSHEWVQPFSEYTGWVQSRQGANSGRAWWIPRGWFTSMGYLRDEQHPYSKAVAFAIRDRIVEAERAVPGLLPLEDRMNARYERFGQRWEPKDMYQPIVNGIRIYMSLKGTAGRGGAAGEGGAAGAGAAAPGSGGVGGLSSDVTWDAAYTEAPDETAHGDYMKLMASAGLAFDYVHLRYLAEGDPRITRTEREQGGTIVRRVERARPILPPGMKPQASGDGQ